MTDAVIIIGSISDRDVAEKLADHRMELAEKTELGDKRINEQKNTDIQD
jgi:hypothetical protein